MSKITNKLFHRPSINQYPSTKNRHCLTSRITRGRDLQRDNCKNSQPRTRVVSTSPEGAKGIVEMWVGLKFFPRKLIAKGN